MAAQVLPVAAAGVVAAREFEKANADGDKNSPAVDVDPRASASKPMRSEHSTLAYVAGTGSTRAAVESQTARVIRVNDNESEPDLVREFAGALKLNEADTNSLRATVADAKSRASIGAADADAKLQLDWGVGEADPRAYPDARTYPVFFAVRKGGVRQVRPLIGVDAVSGSKEKSLRVDLVRNPKTGGFGVIYERVGDLLHKNGLVRDTPHEDDLFSIGR
jgi:hypothetical protein